MPTMDQIKEYVARFPISYPSASLCTVTIKGKALPAVMLGNARIAVWGPLPACYRRNTRIAFTVYLNGLVLPHEYFISHYWPAFKAHAPQNEAASHPCSPLGLSFGLHPWSVPSGKTIDFYEHRRRDRIRVDIRTEG